MDAGSDEEGNLASLTGPVTEDTEKIVEVSPTGQFVRFNDELGSGAYKKVYRGLDNEIGCEVAWNVINIRNISEQDKKRICQEVNLSKNLNHPNIIHFIAAWANPQQNQIVFITELAPGGSLKKYLKRTIKQPPRLRVVKSWCREILNGLNYLHTQKPYSIVHRDLKCDNIFIVSNTANLKIGDFGLSTLMRNSLQTSVLGTPQYMAPEVFDCQYNEKVDIYAFGMVVLEMCTLSRPYSECQTPAAVYKKIIQGVLPESLHRIQDNQLKSFILMCLGPAKDRPSTEDLLKSQFLVINENDPQIHMPVDILQEKCGSENSFTLPFNSIEISLLLTDQEGKSQEVVFNYDKISDTPEKVAEEMVWELKIDPTAIIPIAQQIENKVKKQDKNWGYKKASPGKICTKFKATVDQPNTGKIFQHQESLEQENIFAFKKAFSSDNLFLMGENQIQEKLVRKIKKGSQNDQESVKSLQRMLSKIFDTRIQEDGYYGNKIERLIKEIQERFRVPIDGTVTNQLWTLILQEYFTKANGTRYPNIHQYKMELVCGLID